MMSTEPLDYLRPVSDSLNAEIATVYDEISFWASRFGALLFDHLDIVPEIRILDLGCGTGFPLFELAHRHGASCHITGADIWTDALERARLKSRVYGTTNVTIVPADGHELPFPDGSFELIVSNLGVNNFADPVRALKECRRVAAPNARLALTTNLRGHFREFYGVYRQTLTALGLDRYQDRLTGNEEHRGSKESLGQMLRQSGFAVSKVFEESFHMRFADGSALLRHPLTRLGFLGGWRGAVDSGDEVNVFAALEEALNHLARRQHGLTMTVPMLYIEAVPGRRE